MPSPFPGMDPFLESHEWEDFHVTFNTVIREHLVPGLGQGYQVRVERRVYVEHGLEDDDQVRWADVSVLWTGSETPTAVAQTSPAHATAQPVECLLPMPQERRETYLVIREVETMEVVTVIETLSPANKRASSDGRGQYLAKREEILHSRTNLVEIDLLRGGKRLPVLKLPPADYYAIVSRGHRRPRAEVFHWTLRDRLPTIPIPLRKGDPDVSLDLQRVVATVFDRAGYRLDYSAPLSVPLSDAEASWAASLTAAGK